MVNFNVIESEIINMYLASDYLEGTEEYEEKLKIETKLNQLKKDFKKQIKTFNWLKDFNENMYLDRKNNQALVSGPFMTLNNILNKETLDDVTFQSLSRENPISNMTSFHQVDFIKEIFDKSANLLFEKLPIISQKFNDILDETKLIIFNNDKEAEEQENYTAKVVRNVKTLLNLYKNITAISEICKPLNNRRKVI